MPKSRMRLSPWGEVSGDALRIEYTTHTKEYLMKKLILAILVIVVLLAVSACGKKPETTARAFLDAVAKHDFAAAKQLATEDSQALLSMAESFVNEMGDQQKTEMQEMEYAITKTEVDGDKAIVTFEQWEVSKPAEKKTNTINLVKVDGDWKVKVEKGNAGK